MKLLRSRLTSHSFISDVSLTEDEVRDLIETVATTPSSFNIQHWRFIALTDDAAKSALRAVAFDQAQITESSATFIVLADVKAHERAQEILNRSVASGAMDQKAADWWTGLAINRYSDLEEAKTEAIRSGGMAAMALMTAVADKGWASCPMIGFDAAAVKQEFGIDEQYLPIMLIAVGRRPKNLKARMTRLNVDEILSFNTSKRFF